MKTHRWPAVIVLLALVVGAVTYARGERAPATTTLEGEARLALERAIPHVRASAGAERWFCSGGGAGPAAPVDLQLLLTNVGVDRLDVRVTALREHEGQDAAPPAFVTLEVAPGTTTMVPMGDVLEAPAVGAIVEGEGSGLIVEERVVSSLGRSIGQCASTAGDAWYFAGGATTRDATYTLSVMNPFPDDAVVDVTIETVDGTRVPSTLQGLVVAGRSVVPVDIAEGAQRRDIVAAVVRARSGRIVVHRVHTLDGTVERLGSAVSLGATAPALTWVFPYLVGGEGPPARYVVYNTDELTAEVDVELRPDDAERLFDVEPFALTVEPGRFAMVDLAADESAARVPEDTSYAGLVLGANRVGFVAEQWVSAGDPLTIVPGIPVQATQWLVPAVPGGETALGIVNTSPEAISRVSVEALGPGGWEAVPELGDLEVGPGRRLVILADDLPADAVLRITGSAPIVVGRRITVEGSVSLVPAVVERGTSSEPDPFGLLASPAP